MNSGTQPAKPADPVGQITSHFVYGVEYGASETGQWFMDGGVLDNGPFDHVLDAIAAKRADGPTVRELIYIEPDPGSPPRPDQQAPDPEPTFAKLDGTAIRHFGAFFEQAWRENDYLWGRLDGAELAMRLLARQSGAAVDLTGNLHSALTAILDTEQAGLGQIGPVCRALAVQVKDIKTMGPNGPEA